MNKENDKLTKQVVSLELATKLKELGVEQESLFLWYWDGEKDVLVYKSKFYGNDEISAFTVAEIGDLLPSHIHLKEKRLPQYLFLAKKDNDQWMVGYSDYLTEGTPSILDTEADACAKMLIYLIENKLI